MLTVSGDLESENDIAKERSYTKSGSDMGRALIFLGGLAISVFVVALVYKKLSSSGVREGRYGELCLGEDGDGKEKGLFMEAAVEEASGC